MRLELINVKVSWLTGVLQVSTLSLVIIKMLLEQDGQKGKTRLQYLITYRKRMYDSWNEIVMFETEEQHLACQVRSIFKNMRN